MKIIYSLLPKFAGSGIGNVAYYAVSQIYRCNMLKRLLTTSFVPTEINEKLISTVFVRDLPGFRLTPLLSDIDYIIRDNLYDFLVSFFIDKCDIFHGWAHSCLYCLKKAKKYGAKTVVECASTHILNRKQMIEKEYALWNVRYRRLDSFLIEKSLREYEETDYVFVPSNFAKNTFVQYKFNPDKVAVLPFGVDTKKFQPTKLKDDAFRLIFVGEIGLRKGVQYLLKAWQELKLPKAELVLIGAVAPYFRNILKRYSGLERIKFVGYTNPINYYQQASVFVFPTLEEGLALVILEALACGLPVITTEESGAKGIVREGQEGFFVPARSVEMLKEKISLLYSNQNLRQQMSINARILAEQYTWERYGKQLISIYQKIL